MSATTMIIVLISTAIAIGSGAQARAATSLLSDDFTRTVASGWNASGATTYSGAGTGFAVNGSKGTITAPPGAGRQATVAAAGAAGAAGGLDVTENLAVTALPAAGNGVYTGVTAQNSSQGYYYARLHVIPGGAAKLSLLAVTPSGTTTLAPESALSFSASGAKAISLRLLTTRTSTGTTLKATAWPAGTTQPTTWQRTATSAKLSSQGTASVITYASGSGTSNAVVAVDSLKVLAADTVTTSTSTPTTTPSTSRPGSGNTGVPSGTTLKDVYPTDGVLKVTTASAVIDKQRIHGFVDVRANGVKITNSAIVGPASASTASGANGMLTNTHGNTGLVVQDSTIYPTAPRLGLQGVLGWNVTLTRVNVSKTVDGVMLYGSNGLIQNSWIHDLTVFAHDPAHNNGPTHNDGVQVQGGSNIRILSNTITGGRNSAYMLTQDYSKSSNVYFNGNWVDNGMCHIYVDAKSKGYMTGIQVNNNKLGMNTTTPGCDIFTIAGQSDVNPTGNVKMAL